MNAAPREIDPFLDPILTTASLPQLGAFGAILVAALLLVLFTYRRRIYIFHWTLSWLLVATGQMVVALEYEYEPLALAMLGISQFCTIAGGLLLVLSADSYRRRTSLRREYLLGPLALLIWFALAPLVLGSLAALVPGYLLLAGVLATAGIAYLFIAKRTGLLGAAVIGGPLLLLAASNAWIALSLARAETVTPVGIEIMLLNALLYAVAALGMHLMAFEDMTYELRQTNRRLEAAREELHQMVVTDPLTGCHNRRFFDQVIARELQVHRRYRMPLTLVFVDVDRFKAVNDRLGHERGDRVLQAVAQFLRRYIRETDYIFRWGGDEFLILMSCSLEEARRRGEDLKRTFLTLPEIGGLPSGVGLSVGYAAVQGGTGDIMALVREADERMYEDKLASRPA